jgi:hypothetical protein
MFEKILKELSTCNSEVQDQYIPRMKQVVSDAGNIGWGYYDGISGMLEEFLAD